MSTLTLILIAVAVLAVAFGVIMFMQKRRTERLKGKFGPEYERLAFEQGGRKAEKELVDRQKRIERFHIRELNRAEIDRFSESWRTVQSRFVDAPREAVAEADRLIREVMSAEGYPMGDFDQRAADISVEHPRVVENYRAARDIAVRDASGKANTEDLRQAMVHYRALFEDLLTGKYDQQLHEVTR
jgi:hypothetical protein